MGLVTINNLENNTPANANDLNERFSAIARELNGNLDAANYKNGSITSAKLAPDVFEKIYPVGSVYINAQDATNPATLLGFGTWQAFGAGRVPVGFSADETEFNAAEKTGGEKTHILTLAESPSHNHAGSTSTGGEHSHVITNMLDNFGGGSSNNALTSYPGANIRITDRATTNSGNHSHSFTTDSKGENGAHNNLQPYVTVYMWKRVS